MNEDKTRIDALEMRIAHLEQVLSDLSEMIAGQWTKIDGMERLIRSLREEVQTLGEDHGSEKPPHY